MCVSVQSTQGYLIDIDGTLQYKGSPLPGAVSLIRRLREQDIPFRLLTNTTSLTAFEMAEKLRRMEFDVDPLDILTPNTVVNQYVKESGAASFYYAGGSKFRSEFEVPSDDRTNPACVVLGNFEDVCSYEEINLIAGLLDQGAQLVTTSRSLYFHGKGGKHVDTGAFTVMFEHVSGRRAELIGKPSALFYKMAVRQLNVPLHGIRCIGDDISTDVAGAKEAGLYAILVKTGKYRDFEPTMSNYQQPDEVLDDLSALTCLDT